MKTPKALALIISVLMVVTLFAGCGGAQKEETSKSETAKQEAQTGEAKKEEAKQEESTNKVNKVYAGIAIRTLSNPYMVQIKEGAEMFVNSLPEGAAELQILCCEGSDEKQINDIKALISRGGKDTILYVDPNQSPNAAVIAEICEEAQVYWVSAWNAAEGVYPMDYKYYVAHHSPDNVKSGYDIAVEMFKSFETPGKGKILAIQGMLANTAAIDRFKGLKKALEEYPDVELLDDQAGDWNPQKALNITETWLSKYKDIDGIWVANDSMALAAVQALKAKGLNGKVKVVGVDGIDDAIEAIKNGDMVATVSSNGWLQGGYSLAMAYAAYTGKIDTTKLEPGKRMFHTEGIFITEDNVSEYEEKYVKNKPQYNFEDIFSIIVRPMDAVKEWEEKK